MEDERLIFATTNIDFRKRSREKIEELLNTRIDNLTINDDSILNKITDYPDLYERLISHYKEKRDFVLKRETSKVLKKNMDLVLLSFRNDPESIAYAELNSYEYNKIEDQIIEQEDSLCLINSTHYSLSASFILKICKKNPYNFVYVQIMNFNHELYETIKKYFLDSKISIANKYTSQANIMKFRNSKMFNDIDIIINSIKYTDNIDVLLKILNNRSKILKINEEIISKLLIERNYIINANTPQIFTGFKLLQLRSLEKDPNSIEYMDVISDKEIFELLIRTNNYGLLKSSIKYIDNPIVRELLIKDICSEEIYNLLLSSINKGININNLNKFIRILAERLFDNEKESNPEVFNNVYSNAMTILDQSENAYFFRMNWVLYQDSYLYTAFGKDYHDITIKNLIERYYYNRRNGLDNSNELKEFAKICREFGDRYKQARIKSNILKIEATLRNINLVKINIDGKKVKKLIKEKRQRELFFKKVEESDEYKDILEDIRKKVKSTLKTDYKLREHVIDNIIDSVFIGKTSIINEPPRYQDLLLKIEIDRIVNRLNSGNIDESHKDYIKYKDYINYRIENGKKIYYSDAINLTKSELFECNEYIAYLTVIKQTNKLLMPFIKKIDVEITKDDILMAMGNVYNLSFDEDTVTFNHEVLNDIRIEDIKELLIELNKLKNIINDKEYKVIEDLLFKEDLLLIALYSKSVKGNINESLYTINDLINLVKTIPNLLQIYNINKINLENIKDVLLHSQMLNYLSSSDYSIIGEDLVNKTIKNNAFNPDNMTTKERLERTIELYLGAISKNYFTVPRVKGNYLDYTYSIMEQDDPLLLSTGFEVDSCIRVGGHENDFLHYCCLDKNGFIIKITDKEGNFIGRVAGFRNGNGLFLNQLRTIYDIHSTESKHIPLTLKRELIQVLKSCCDHILESTKGSKEPIDFIMITNGFTCSDLDRNEFGIRLDHGLYSHLKKGTPVDTTTPDYQEFNKIKTINNHRVFGTEYSLAEGLICISARTDYIDESYFKQYDPTITYKRHRNNIETTILNESNYAYFDRLNNICNKVKNIDYKELDRSYLSKHIIYGTNWFIIYDEDILYSNYLITDQIATIEINETINSIKSKKI